MGGTVMTTTFLKRQKERKRQEKQIAKAQKRAQKKLEAQARLNNPDAFAVDVFEPPDPNDLNAVSHPDALAVGVSNGPGSHADEAYDFPIRNARDNQTGAPAVPSANTSYFASKPASDSKTTLAAISGSGPTTKPS